ncbi:MAG: hypothetical protein ACTTJ6_05170 [Treponema sp.]
MNEEKSKISNTSDSSSVIPKAIGIISGSILAYCGYKIVDNKLVKTYYEPDPNKSID